MYKWIDWLFNKKNKNLDRLIWKIKLTHIQKKYPLHFVFKLKNKMLIIELRLISNLLFNWVNWY